MKKFIILILVIFVSSLNVWAIKIAPQYKNSIRYEGIGIISLPQKFSIYEKPDTNSKILKSFRWGNFQSAYVEDYSGFVIYEPLENIAYMTVLDDTEQGGWYKVCYDQKNGSTGWVAPQEYRYYPWISFFIKYGKKNGLYAYRDLDNVEKRLYSKPETGSKIVNTFERARNIQVQMFRGNWVLVRVYDVEGNLKIGWIRWRTDEGKFNLFPNVIK